MTRFRSREKNGDGPTPRPAVIRTARDRGQALRNWLDVHRTPIKAFAEAAGMDRNTLHLYLEAGRQKKNGVEVGKVYDLAGLEQPQAAALIVAMGVTDSEAWEILGIPLEARNSFRTFRPPPWGHGESVRAALELRLAEPMMGEVALPGGTMIRIDPNVEDARFHVVRLEDGRLYSVTPLLLGRAGGEHLGALVSAHF